MKKYIPPAEVVSPKRHWVLVDVLVPAKENKIAIALGRWDGGACIGLRWNGDSQNPIGNPQSRGLPTWFMLDDREYIKAILDSARLTRAKMDLARTFLDL